jgi:hypothetical protein
MTTNSILPYHHSPSITIGEALTEIPVSNLVRLVAQCGTEKQAIAAAKALAISKNKIHIIQIIDERQSVRHLFIRPNDVRAEYEAIKAADSFIATRQKMKAIASVSTQAQQQQQHHQPSWFARLKERKAQPSYFVFTGEREDCLEGCKHWPGSRMKRNGENGGYLLIVPSIVINSDRQFRVAA